jgi:hypothetical protein
MPSKDNATLTSKVTTSDDMSIYVTVGISKQENAATPSNRQLDDTGTTSDEETTKTKRGRPRSVKPVPDNHLSAPTEAQYLNSDKYLPFSNSIRADLYLKLKRLEFHSGKSIRFVLEEMMESYLALQPQAYMELPEKEVQKLKQLKSALDYHNDKKPD